MSALLVIRLRSLLPDRIRRLKLSHVVLPLETPVSDAKVLTGRQKPLTEPVLLFVEVTTEQGHEGMGFSYSKRAGGRAQYAYLEEIADVALGQDPSDIDRIYQSLLWAGASVGRSGVATQAIAALDVALWDLKARRAGLPLAKLIGAHRDHLHLAATYPTEPWVEHFEWLNPLFNERMEIRDGRIWVPERPGLGFTLSEQMRALTKETAEFGTR